jgi:cysteinyl-tRNA synthetase
VMQSQYRMPLDFTEEAISAAKKGWETLKDGLSFGLQHGQTLAWKDDDEIALDESALQSFQASMDDDFNTPGAIAVLFGLAKELQRQGNLIVHEGNSEVDSGVLQQRWKTLVQLAQVLGLEVQETEQSVSADSLSDADIEALIEQRTAAKQAKNYGESDRIRNDLSAQGITLIDKPGGVTLWHR